MSANLKNKGYHSRDSIQNYDYQSDLFYTIRHPQRSLADRPPPIDKTLDRVESAQAKIDQQVKERFLSKSQWGFIGKIGKFLFLTLMLPPYLIFIEFPRRILCDGVPYVVRLLVKLFKRIGQEGNRFFKKIAGFWNKIAQKFKFSKSRERFIKQKERFNRFQCPLDRWVASFLCTVFDPLLEPMRKCARFLKGQLRLMQAFFRRNAQVALGYVRGKLHVLRQYLGVKIEKVLSIVETYCVNPVKAWLLHLRKWGVKVENKVLAAAKTFNGVFKQPKLKTQAFFASIIRWLSQAPLTSIREKSVVFFAHFQKALRRYFLSFKKLFVVDADKIKEKIKEVKLKMMQVGSKLTKVRSSIVIPSSIKKAPKLIKDKAVVLLYRFQSYTKVISNRLRVFFKGGAHVMSVNAASVALRWKAYRTVLSSNLSRLAKYPKLCGEIIVKGSDASAYYLRLGVAWTKVLTGYGIQLLTEISQKIGKG